jgi:uncharacterized protein
MLNEVLLFDLTLLQLLLITLCMIAGASLQASAGFGSGLVAVPLLGLIDLRLVPGPILFAYIFLNLMMSWRERAHISAFHVQHMSFGLFIGTLFGVVLLVSVEQRYFPLLAASIVLAGVLLSFISKEIQVNRNNLTFAGSLSGLMNLIAGLSGPPIALLLQHQQPGFLRANLAVTFVFASFLSIAALALNQRFYWTDIWLGFCLLPGIVLGFVVGQMLAKYISAEQSRILIIVISTVSALLLIAKSI